MGGWDKHIVPVPDHEHCDPLCERLFCNIEVAQNNVAVPPTPEADRVYVNTCHEEDHGAAGPHRARADIFWCENHLGSDDCGCGTEHCGYLGTTYYGPLNSVENCGEMRVWVAPFCRKCATQRRMADTAHARGCLVAPCPIDSSLTPFFCVLNRRLTEVVAAQVVAEALVACVGRFSTKNWMLHRLTGVETVSVLSAQYSPGRRGRKKAIQEMSAIALSLGEPLLATESMQWRMETGRWRTLPGAGSSSA